MIMSVHYFEVCAQMLEIGLPDHIDGSHMMISSCPLLPQQQTFERTAQSVEKCQNRTSLVLIDNVLPIEIGARRRQTGQAALAPDRECLEDSDRSAIEAGHTAGEIGNP
jgi:hypothetical protein